MPHYQLKFGLICLVTAFVILMVLIVPPGYLKRPNLFFVTLNLFQAIAIVAILEWL